MKSKEEIEQLALLKYPKFSSDSYNPDQDDNYYERLIWIEGYTQCQEDMAKEYTKDDIDEMALDYIINTGGLPQTIGDWKHALWKFYEQLNKTGS